MGDVDIILVPAAFTATTGRAHFETLMRARAIENLAYVIAPAQGGYHVSGRETHGDSMIVDPWGNVLDRLPRGSGVVVAGINRELSGQLAQEFAGVETPHAGLFQRH
jgi:deaminated glutathione amidase